MTKKTSFGSKLYTALVFIFLYAINVFCSKHATVIGPTPPGTGVIIEHFSSTFGLTSPYNFPFSVLIPTSIIIASFFIISLSISHFFPTAILKMQIF